jgi:hypothetical protein
LLVTCIGRLLLLSRNPITTLKVSSSGTYVTVGTVDGTTYLFGFDWEEHLPEKDLSIHEPASESFFNPAEDESTFEADNVDSKTVKEGIWWKGHVHDLDNGRVTSCVTSFDDSFMMSAGSDGGLFVWRVTMQHVKRGEGTKGPLLKHLTS